MTDPNQFIQTALQHHLAGRLDQAEPLYRQVLRAHPNQADALHLLGVLIAQRGDATTALPLLLKAVQIAPGIAEFHRHVGDVYGMLSRQADALNSYLAALRIDGRDAVSAYNAARAAAALDRYPEAAHLIQHVVNLDPSNISAWADFGIILVRLHQYPQAHEALQRSLALNPDFGPALTSLSDVLRHLNRYDEAYEPARRGAQLQPNEAWPHVAFGNILQVLAKFDEAIEQYQLALKLDPTNFDATNNLGLTLLKNGQPREALELLENAVKRWPDKYDLRANYSLALLTLGDLDRGFLEYEARFKSAAFRDAPLPAGERWHGSDIAGKTILLNSEQGLGDTIQFARYIPLMTKRGAKVIVFCPPEIRDLIATIDGASAVIETGSVPPPFDTWAPMASLPHIFRTTEGTIPAQVPYLKSDPARIAHWRDRLSSSQLKVGIVWAGSPLHQNDRARSCKLEMFLPLEAIENVKLYSLQKGPAASALRADMPIENLGPQLTTFTDTAALLEVLDLVISVDTSVVHVAGALARPVWTLLPSGPDWRWMTARPDSPWYPTMKLFRQPTPGDWPSVFQQVASDLRALSQQRTTDH